MNNIDINFKARYYDNGVIPEEIQSLWFVIHGYGQLARYFINKFDILKSSGIRVVAPEGLHRFYLKESRGRVGASWMTKEDRLTDIHNYLNYLNAVYDNEMAKCPTNVKITFLGFSQGAATVSRWITDGTTKFNNLILWAGLFPPDLDFSVSREILKDKNIKFVYGTEDPYLNDDRFAEMELLTSKLAINPEILRFNGGHSIDKGVLADILKSNG